MTACPRSTRLGPLSQKRSHTCRDRFECELRSSRRFLGPRVSGRKLEKSCRNADVGPLKNWRWEGSRRVKDAADTRR
eukprot:5154756-Pleurochrysis_carterae.AAC.1